MSVNRATRGRSVSASTLAARTTLALLATTGLLIACAPGRVPPSPPLVRVSVEGGRITEVDRGLRSGSTVEVSPGPHALVVAFDVRGAEIGPGVGEDWQATVTCRIELRAGAGRRYLIRIRRREGAGLQGPKDALYGAEILDDRGWRAPGLSRCEWRARPQP